MRIAQVAPLHESIPPELYGGTERFFSFLTEEFVNKGQGVTLYASGDSATTAKLIPLAEKAFRLNPCCNSSRVPHIFQCERLLQDSSDHDIVKLYIDLLCLTISGILLSNQVTALHGRRDLTDMGLIFNEYKEMAVVSMSDNQRLPLPTVNWQGSVYNGIDERPYTFRPDRGRYLEFSGLTSPEKRIEEAIEIALRYGIELRIAAKIDPEI